MVYVLSGGNIKRRITGGDATAEQIAVAPGDALVVLRPNQEFVRRTVTVNDQPFLADDRFAVKFIGNATGLIGGKEVAISAKQI